MKKLIVSMMLIISMFAFAAESDPSATVGYVKYPLVTTTGSNLNMIALPLEAGYVNASDLDNAGTNIDQVSKWDEVTQGWNSAGYGMFGWTNDFTVSTGQGLLCNTKNAIDFVVDGDLVTIPAYNLITTTGTNLNMIMHPLTKSTITTASGLGNDIVSCDQVSEWDNATQGWNSAGYGMFGWTNDFNTDIAKGLLVNATADVTWPGAKGQFVDTQEEASAPKGLPRNVFYHVEDPTGLQFDFTAAPYDNITFKAWITARPSEIIDETNGGDYEMLGGAFSAVFVNIGNFTTEWAAGDQVQFKVKDESDPDFNNWVYGTQTTVALDGNTTDYYGGFDDEGMGGGAPISVSSPTSIEEGNIPAETTLHQNYPNPFNPNTTIRFDLASSDVVKLNVYNFSGQLVQSLVNGQVDAGTHTVNFDASSLSAGVYYYALEANNSVMTNKMILVK